MELERDGLVSPNQEVPVIEGELVATIRELASRGVGSKTIARTMCVARKTVVAVGKPLDRRHAPAYDPGYLTRLGDAY